MLEPENTLLACPYCGDTMDMPNEDIIKRFGMALDCCEFPMVKLDKSNLYKLLKGLDALKTAVEREITKDF